MSIYSQNKTPATSQTGSATSPLPIEPRPALAELEALGRIVQTNLDVLVRLSEHAKKNVFAELEYKLKELSGKELKHADVENRAKMLNLEASKNNSDRKALEEDRSNFEKERENDRIKMKEEGVVFLQQRIQYAVPKFLKTDEAKVILSRMQPFFETTSEGKQLQIFLGLVAIIEDPSTKDKDRALQITAIVKLFPLLRMLDARNGTTSGGFVDEIAKLIEKDNELSFQIKVPKVGDRVESWMNPPFNVKIVSEVRTWAVFEKGSTSPVRPAEVK